MTDQEVIIDAIKKHNDCSFGVVKDGINAFLQRTRVVQLWRNEECYNAGDPPRHTIQGYPKEK